MITYIVGIPIFETQLTLLVDQDLLDLHHRIVFWFQLLVAASRYNLFQLVEGLHQVLLVLETQLLCNDLEIAHGIHLALHMRHIGIFEGTTQMENAITSADVRKKVIAQALSLGGALDQAGDVDHIEVCGHNAARRVRER